MYSVMTFNRFSNSRSSYSVYIDKYIIENITIKKMATNSSGTVDISVYVTLDKEEDKNILSFIVQDEYHLKKLAVGAYNINILETQIISKFYDYKQHSIVACGDYVVLYNFNLYKNLNVILFNIKPIVLKKGGCIFKIIFFNTDKMLQESNDINTKSGKRTSSTGSSSHTSSVQSSKNTPVEIERLSISPTKTKNSQLFNEVFSQKRHSYYSDENDEEDSRSSSSSVDEENHLTAESNGFGNKSATAMQHLSEQDDGQLANKRQKLDD
ncbi:hypothetical protein [Rachiplusia nu nucleopolyhedrovirus]|uniref:TLP-20 n=1 Tax=Rachiplusia nu nucleopolyhedrovirus TaxID=2605775 RepID=A0AAF1DB56_9ABAC|nr:hypothetical protein QKQ55_gp076 [Rachiplusia nu nucleopolyhedrovirus]QEI03676.1 hypothetical protein [Rachiplusia nu nucleopolyhedrovirus]